MIVPRAQKFFRELSKPPKLMVTGCIRLQPEILFRREYSKQSKWWHWWTEPSKKWVVKNCIFTFIVGARTKQSAIKKTVQLFHDLGVPLNEQAPACRLSGDVWKSDKPTVWHARLGEQSTLVSAGSYEEAHEKAELYFQSMVIDGEPEAPLELWRFDLRDNLR